MNAPARPDPSPRPAEAPAREDEHYRRFYASIDRERVYTKDEPDDFARVLDDFLDRKNLRSARVLEVGSGKGSFQGCATGYVGVDVAEGLRRYYHDPSRFRVIEDGGAFPFPDDAFDAAFTHAVFEHIPSVENALLELYRVVKPGGWILFHAAWQVRPWAARGLSARPYRDLTWRDRTEKLLIPLRNSVVWRSLFVIPARLARLARLRASGSKRREQWKLDYRRLDPNYEVFWQSDSDACNHIDIHAAMIWFLARGCALEGYPTPLSTLRARTGHFVVHVRKPDAIS